MSQCNMNHVFIFITDKVLLLVLTADKVGFHRAVCHNNMLFLQSSQVFGTSEQYSD